MVCYVVGKWPEVQINCNPIFWEATLGVSAVFWIIICIGIRFCGWFGIRHRTHRIKQKKEDDPGASQRISYANEPMSRETPGLLQRVINNSKEFYEMENNKSEVINVDKTQDSREEIKQQ